MKCKAQIDVLLFALDTLPRCIVERTVPTIFSADETTNVGREAGTPVTPDYDRHGSVFSGRVNWVQIDLDKEEPIT